MRLATDPPLEALVHRWRLPLFSIAAAQLREIDEAEDVVQTVLLRVARRGSLADVRDPGAYLRTAVLNQCRTRQARRRAVRPLPAAEELPATSTMGQTEGAELQGLLRDAIRGLPEAHRLAMWLVHVEGLAPQEAARLLGQKDNTVKSALARGRRLLRERLGPVLRKAGYLAM